MPDFSQVKIIGPKCIETGRKRIVIIVLSWSRRGNRDFVDDFHARSHLQVRLGKVNFRESVQLKECSAECQNVLILWRRSEGSRVLLTKV